MEVIVIGLLCIVGIFGLCKSTLHTIDEYKSTGKSTVEREFENTIQYVLQVKGKDAGSNNTSASTNTTTVNPVPDKQVSVTDNVSSINNYSNDSTNDIDTVKNIAKNTKDITWFVHTRKDIPQPSAAELIIINALNRYNIRWEREVSFRGLQFNTYSYPRYDIYLYDYNIVIEYDGKYYHNTSKAKATDKAKNKFCSDNQIELIRYNSKHYYHLSAYIDALMKRLNVKRKPL